MVKRIAILHLLFFFFLLITSAYGAPQNLAILPMKINAAQDYSFLQTGVMDMLSSRLAWKDKLQVIEKSKTLAAVKQYGEVVDEQGAETVGKALGADYVVYGSLTILGQSVSIDTKILDVAEKNVVDSVFTQAKSMDEVIPKINQFAQSINSKVFGRGEAPSEVTAEADTGDNGQETAKRVKSPLLAPAYLMSPTEKIQISKINPNFLLEKGVIGKEMVWKSQMFPFHVKGFDIGDLDGDGKNELVAVSDNEIRIFRMGEAGLSQIASSSNSLFTMFLSVDVGDFNWDGKDEIYASAEEGDAGLATSFVYEFAEGQLKKKITGLPWYLRVVNIPDEGETLIGQRKGGEEGFDETKIYRLNLKDNKITQGQVLNLPRYTNFSNFNYVSFKGGVKRIVRINKSEYLQVLNLTGDVLWESDVYYGGTVNYVRRHVEAAYISEGQERIYFPARIIVADLDNDGTSEIIVNKNQSTTFRLTQRYKVFSSGQLVSLSWQGLGLTENWATRKIPGYISDYCLNDLDGDGNLDLVASMVKLNPFGLRDAKSTIIAFTLLSEEDRSQIK